MSLAQRVRDIRYAKGWGPDELANRAEISRTALYQIESGKTGLPRAGTLRTDRRGAGSSDGGSAGIRRRSDEPVASHVERQPTRRPRGLYDWVPSEGGPLSFPNGAGVKAVSIATAEESRFAVEPEIPARTNGHESMYSAGGRADVEASRPASFADRQTASRGSSRSCTGCFPECRSSI